MWKKRFVLLTLIALLFLTIQSPQVSRAAPKYATGGFNSQFTSHHKGWKVIKGTWKLAKGKYKTRGIKNKTASIVHNYNYSTLTYVVRMKATGDEYSAGLWFRGDPTQKDSNYNWKNGYVFYVGNQGQYFIGYQKNGDLFQIELDGDPIIRKHGWNKLKVTAKGNFLQFFINGKKVACGNYAIFSSGKVGIFYHRFSTKGNLFVDWAKLKKSAPSSVSLGDSGVRSDDILLDPDSEVICGGIFDQ